MFSLFKKHPFIMPEGYPPMQRVELILTLTHSKMFLSVFAWAVSFASLTIVAYNHIEELNT